MLRYYIHQDRNPPLLRNTNPIKLALIGGGPSCVAAYLELANRLSREISEIVIFDPVGVMSSEAFTCESEVLITNTSVGVTSIRTNCDYDFLSWLNSNYNERSYTPESFVPRKFVAEYIRDRFDIARKHLECIGCTTRIVRDYVSAIEVTHENNYEVRVGKTTQGVFDFVIICTGCANKELPSHLKHHPDVVPTPYPESNLLQSTIGAENVLVFGSKLSAIDTALILIQLRPNIRITFASTSGFLPSVRDALLVHTPRRFCAKSIRSQAISGVYNLAVRAATLDMKEAKQSATREHARPGKSAQDQLMVDIIACEQGSNYWQASMGSFIDEANEVWPLLSLGEQRKLVAKFKGFNSRLISAFPQKNAKIILEALNRNQLSIVATDTKRCVVPAPTGGFDGRDELAGAHYDKIINATGVDTSSFCKSTLGQSLYSTGWKRNPHGGLLVDSATMQMKNANKMHNALYALGAPVAGSVLVTNYLRSSVIQAHRAVDNIHGIVCGRVTYPAIV